MDQKITGSPEKIFVKNYQGEEGPGGLRGMIGHQGGPGKRGRKGAKGEKGENGLIPSEWEDIHNRLLFLELRIIFIGVIPGNIVKNIFKYYYKPKYP